MIIERPDLVATIRDASKWVLVYGRRKTGKTFLVRGEIRPDDYFFVKRDRTVVEGDGGESIPYPAFLALLRRGLQQGRRIAVDEFPRLGDDFLDELQAMRRIGNLILISSTLALARKVFSARSPLLGSCIEVPVPIMRLAETLPAGRTARHRGRELVEWAVLAREPLAIDHLEVGRSARATFARMLRELPQTVPSLVGEVFLEEERGLSAVYEGVLRAVATGKVVSGEIAGYLFSRRLLAKHDPSLIQPYLANLVSFGLLRRVVVAGKRRFVYRHASPLTWVFFAGDERYNILERRPPEEELRRLVDEMMPRLVEDAVREALATRLGLQEGIAEGADFDVDAVLLRFRTPEVVAEVKWGKRVRSEEIRKSEETLGRFRAKRRLLVVADRKGLRSRRLEIREVPELLGS